MTFLKIWALALPFLIIGDLFWLGFLMKDFYRSHLGHLMSGSVEWIPAVVFYLIFSGGLVYFAILPGINEHSLIKVILTAALFGFVSYATYDLTNHATLRDWPLTVTLVDIAWGTALSSAIGAIAFMLAKYF